MLSDPNVDKGIWLAVATVLAAISYWFKRRINWADGVTERLTTLEKHSVTKKQFDASIRRLHHRMNNIINIQLTGKPLSDMDDDEEDEEEPEDNG